MSKLNELNLNRSHAEIARDLAARGKQELRAKMVNGRTVLYLRSVNVLTKWVDNRFFHRQDKLKRASALLAHQFAGLPKTIVAHARSRRPVAADLQVAFSMSSEVRRGKKAGLSEVHLKENAAHFSEFLDYVIQTGKANDAQLGEEAKRLLTLTTVMNSGTEQARNVLADFMIELLQDGDGEINVQPDKQLHMIVALGINLPGFAPEKNAKGEVLLQFTNAAPQSKFTSAMKAYDWNSLRNSALTRQEVVLGLTPAYNDLVRSFRDSDAIKRAYQEWKGPKVS